MDYLNLVTDQNAHSALDAASAQEERTDVGIRIVEAHPLQLLKLRRKALLGRATVGRRRTGT